MEQDKGNLKMLSWVAGLLSLILLQLIFFFEFFNGSNILGFSSEFNGRIASFTGDELKIGNYYLDYTFISCFFIKIFTKNISFFLYFITHFLVSSFL